jgi:hypothetical protein
VTAPAHADLVRANEVVRVIKERGVVHADDLADIVGCDRAELRAAIGIALHWRRVDRCASWLVAIPSREGRRAA